MTEKEKNVQTDTQSSVDSDAVRLDTDSKLNTDITEEKPKRTRRSLKKKEREPIEQSEKSITELPEAAEVIDSAPDELLSPDSESENKTADEEKDPLPDEEEFIIPLFDFSKDTPVFTEDEEAYSDKDVEEELGDGILPPDMLFSDIHRETPDNSDTETEEISEDAEQFFSDEDDCCDTADDGQYTIFDLPETESEQIRKPEPKEDCTGKKPRRVDSRFDLVELFVFTLVAVMILMSFFFRHSIVQGPSMENTLHNGEHLIISDFLYTPKRGDVIVCEDHTTNIKYPIVKRVIAVGGDTVEIRRDAVYVNGVPENNPHVYFSDPNYKYTPTEAFKVPDGELFVMGDHRDNSTDSRDTVMLGTIKEDAVLGRVLFRFFPFSKFGTVN